MHSKEKLKLRLMIAIYMYYPRDTEVAFRRVLLHFPPPPKKNNVLTVLTATQNIGHLSLFVEVLTNFVVTALIGLSKRHPGGKTYNKNKYTIKCLFLLHTYSTQLGKRHKTSRDTV